MRAGSLWEHADRLDNVRVIVDSNRCRGDAESYVLKKLEGEGIKVACPRTPGQSHTEPGHPDLICFYERGREYVEVKYRKDHISVAQLKWMVEHPDRRVVIYCVEGAGYPKPRAHKKRIEGGFNTGSGLRVLSAKEIQSMRESCKNKRDLAILEFLRSTGCLVLEMLFARIGDVDLNGGTVFLRRTRVVPRWRVVKGRRRYEWSEMSPRSSPLDVEAVKAVEDYVRERRNEGAQDSDPLFTIDQNERRDGWMTRHIMKSIARDAGIPDWKTLSPKAFRNTCAYKLLSSGYSVGQVKGGMGLSQRRVASWEG